MYITIINVLLLLPMSSKCPRRRARSWRRTSARCSSRPRPRAAPASRSSSSPSVRDCCCCCCYTVADAIDTTVECHSYRIYFSTICRISCIIVWSVYIILYVLLRIALVPFYSHSFCMSRGSLFPDQRWICRRASAV